MEIFEAIKKTEKRIKQGYFLVSAIAIASADNKISKWTLIYQDTKTKNTMDTYVNEGGIEFGKESANEENFHELKISQIKISSKEAISKARKEIDKIAISVIASLISKEKPVWKISIISQDLMATSVEINAVNGKILKKSETVIGKKM